MEEAKTLPERVQFLKNLECYESQFLNECIVHIYDKDIHLEASELCNLGGGMIVEMIIPRLTTHIVTQKLTADLKNHVNQIQSEVLQ